MIITRFTALRTAALMLLSPGVAMAQLGPLPGGSGLTAAQFPAALLGTDLSPSMSASPTGMPRSLASRAGDVIRPEEYGATHTGTLTAIGTRYGADVAGVAGYTAANGTHPFAFMNDPLFGATFVMTPSVSSASAAQTFLMDHLGINNSHATVATWQDPAHGNYLVAIGMQVTGSCLAGISTVTAIGRTPGLVGAADPTYGQIRLSPAPSSACGSTTPLTFKLSPSQVQALSVDWLGWQAAMAQAFHSPNGGDVHGQRGMYVLNHSLVNPGGITDSNGLFPNIEVSGAGIAETTLYFPADLGFDMAAIAETNSADGIVSASHYHEFTIRGPANGHVNGTGSQLNGVAVGMDGLRIGRGAVLRNLIINAVRAGVSGVNDHWELHTVVSGTNACGVEFRAYTYTMGNQVFEDGSLGGNSVASVCVATTNQMDSGLIKNVHTGFGPRGFDYYKNTANVSQVIGGLVTNTTLIDVWIEEVSYCWICGDEHTGIVAGNTFVGGGGSGLTTNDPNFSIPNGSGGYIAPVALIDAGDFVYNTMVGTDWSPYSVVSSDAIIVSSGACLQNDWMGDINFVFGALPTVSQFDCAGGGNIPNNTFSGGFGSGVFRNPLYGAVTQFEALTEYGYSGVGAFTEGNSFVGLAATAMNNGPHRSVAVLKTAPAIPPARTNAAAGVPKTNASQAIHNQQPVFAEAGGGVSGGISQARAIGVAIVDSNSGQSAVSIALDPGMAAGAPGASTGLTAAGITQGAATQITAGEINQFSTVVAGANGVMLGIIPVGTSETVCNDGVAAMAIYPPLGNTIQGLAQNASAPLATGACGSYKRLSQTLWHQ